MRFPYAVTYLTCFTLGECWDFLSYKNASNLKIYSPVTFMFDSYQIIMGSTPGLLHFLTVLLCHDWPLNFHLFCSWTSWTSWLLCWLHIWSWQVDSSKQSSRMDRVKETELTSKTSVCCPLCPIIHSALTHAPGPCFKVKNPLPSSHRRRGEI